VTTGGCHVWGGRSDFGGTGSETRLYLTAVIKTHKIIHKFAKRKNYSLWGPPQSSILGVYLPKTPTKRSAPGFRRGLPPALPDLAVRPPKSKMQSFVLYKLGQLATVLYNGQQRSFRSHWNWCRSGCRCRSDSVGIVVVGAAVVAAVTL